MRIAKNVLESRLGNIMELIVFLDEFRAFYEARFLANIVSEYVVQAGNLFNVRISSVQAQRSSTTYCFCVRTRYFIQLAFYLAKYNNNATIIVVFIKHLLFSKIGLNISCSNDCWLGSTLKF